jgi:hypothetical protein
MKKTLIALAVLAASGASFAQVTVTGKLGFSYQKDATAGGGSTVHGLKMSDGDLNFKATEDLGSGMSITASSAFVSRGRTTGITSRDASLTLVTGAGAFAMGSVESPNTIVNTAGAPVSLATGHDNGVVLAAASDVDYVAYIVPVGPVTLSLAYSDSIGGAGSGAGSVQANAIRADYAAGPLKASLDFTAFSAAAAAGTQADGLTRTRLSGSYDLGMAVIGAGVQVGNHDKPMETSVSVNVPLGAVSVGLVYSNKASQGTTTYTAAGGAAIAAADAKSGTAVGATYMLSKTANINASYGTYSTSTGQDNEFRLRLLKSF